MKRALDSSGYVETVFMNLSKANECVLLDLLIVKLEVYGLEHNVLDFLSVWNQRNKMVQASAASGI